MIAVEKNFRKPGCIANDTPANSKNLACMFFAVLATFFALSYSLAKDKK